MKLYLSTFISLLLLSSPVIGQSERPETIIIPVSSMGDVSDTRKKIIQNTLTQELSKHFQILPQDRFEQVQEQVFNELEYDECTEDQCIMRIQEILQIENLFHLEVIGEEGDTQLNLKWVNLDEKRNRVDYCEGCKTNELRKRVVGLVEKLVGGKPLVVVEKPIVVRKEKGILFRDTPYSKFVESGEKWIKFGDEKTQVKYEGEIVDGVPNGEGTLTWFSGDKYVGKFKDGLQNGQGTFTFSDGREYVGEFKDGNPWKGTMYIEGILIGKWLNGKEQ